MRIIVLPVVILLAATIATAQQPQLPLETTAFAPPSLFVPTPFAVGSGPRTNPGPAHAAVWTDGVVVPWASSLVLRFSVADLGTDDDWIEVHGLADRETQRLDRTRLKQWRNESARFNGGVVALTLHLAPGSTGRVEVDLAYAGSAPGAPDTECGNADDRVTSTDARVCRLVINNGGICTGWLMGTRSVIGTAGHCGWAGTITSYRAEFSVPASTAAGAIVAPPVADQFPVDINSVEFEDTNGVGSDWAVVRLHPNSTGEMAFARQGSSFSLATSLPGPFVPWAGPTVRMTGCGGDTGNDNFTKQTDTGALDNVVGDAVFHHVDTEGGCSGGPVFLTSNSEVIAIHTDGGCDSNPLSSNGATSILRAGLQTAIDNVTGCASIALPDATSTSISCTNTLFNITPDDTKWNVVGVSSTSDWDIEMDGSSSAAGGDTCDFLLANGHLGALPPRSGRIFRFSGSSTSRAQFDTADTLTVGTPFNTTWSSVAVTRIYEFNVATAGTFDVGVFGDPSLGWRLYGPGTSSAWRSRGSSTLEASGVAGGNVVSSVSLGAGFNAIVVFRDGNAAAPSPSELTISVCTNTTALALALGTETAVASAAREFSITPSASNWNAVGIGADAASTFDAYLGTGQSTVGGTVTNFVLADGNQGAIGTTIGLFQRVAGTGGATAVHLNATTLTVGGQFDSSLAAGELLDLFRFTAAAAGNFTINVSGGAGTSTLFWRLFAPQAGTQWISRSDSISSGTVGGGTATVALGAGVHALAIYVNGAPVAATQSYGVNVCQAVATLDLGTVGTAAITASCQTFQFTSNAGQWHAIGLSSAAASNWDLAIGEAESESAGGNADFMVANGNLGTVSPTAGIAVRETGADPAQIDYDSTQTVTLGSSTSELVNASESVEIFELTVTAADSYDIGVTGSAALEWALFAPGSSSAWQPRSAAFQSGVVPGGTTVSLTPGVWALVVFREVATGVSDSFTASFALTPNPVPALNTIAPNSAISLGAGFSLTANGSNFAAESVVRWNGSPLATVFVSASQLTATVPAALIAAAGTASVTVFSPVPGGGLSGAQTFTINHPVPILTSISPASGNAGGPVFALTLNGSSFRTTSVARWNGSNLATIFASATQLSASVPASLIASAGTALVTVFTPGPGGGTSAARTFTINNPPPVLASVVPNPAVAGSPTIVVNLNGSGFVSTSIARVNGIAVPTTFVNSGQVQGTLAAGLLATPGVLALTVFNPAPGGGSSGAVSYGVVGPALLAVSPTTIAVMTPVSPAFTVTATGLNFLAVSVIHANGTPLATTFVNATTLRASVGPAILQTQRIGGIAIHVANTATAISNGQVIEVGAWDNDGLVSRRPLNPAPGGSYSAFLEDVPPNALFSLYVDGDNVAPVGPFIDPTMNNVLAVSSYAGSSMTLFLPLIESFGLFGPANPVATTPQGNFTLPGFVLPSPVLGINLTVQGLYLDATAPYGIRLTWARFPDSF